MVKGRTFRADTLQVLVRLWLEDDPRRAQWLFGAMLVVALALTVLVATGMLETRGEPPAPAIERAPAVYV